MIRNTSGLTIFRLVLLLGAQQRESVLDACLPQLVEVNPMIRELQQVSELPR